MLVRVLGGAVLALGLIATAAAAQDGDVLAPARAGQLQCFEPNVAAKTCQSLGSFAFHPNGVIDNAAEMVLMPQPLIVMRATAPVTLQNNAICGPITSADIDRATFTINGAAASAEESAQLKAAMQQQLAPMFGQETCLTLTPVDGGFRADSTVAGTARPDLAQRVIWVGANDGWRVAP